MITRIVSLGLLCVSASMAYAMDEECTCTMTGDGVDIASKEVSKKEWEELALIRTAVYAKEGDGFRKAFKTNYRPRSVEAVKALVCHFDKDWIESEAAQYRESIPY